MAHAPRSGLWIARRCAWCIGLALVVAGGLLWIYAIRHRDLADRERAYAREVLIDTYLTRGRAADWKREGIDTVVFLPRIIDEDSYLNPEISITDRMAMYRAWGVAIENDPTLSSRCSMFIKYDDAANQTRPLGIRLLILGGLVLSPVILNTVIIVIGKIIKRYYSYIATEIAR